MVGTFPRIASPGDHMNRKTKRAQAHEIPWFGPSPRFRRISSQSTGYHGKPKISANCHNSSQGLAYHGKVGNRGNCHNSSQSRNLRPMRLCALTHKSMAEAGACENENHYHSQGRGEGRENENHYHSQGRAATVRMRIILNKGSENENHSHPEK
jgi:hypothetical protein